MSRPNLSDVINGRLALTGIIQNGDEQVVAVDVFGPWAAVFRFSVSPTGDFYTDTDIAGLRSPGSWEVYTGGGMRGGGWELPWHRPREGWPGGHVVALCHCGMDVTVDDEDVEIIAVSGFVSAAADAIRVSTPAADRLIVPSSTGAFVAVGLGRGFDFMTVTATAAGEPLSPGYSFPSPH